MGKMFSSKFKSSLFKLSDQQWNQISKDLGNRNQQSNNSTPWGTPNSPNSPWTRPPGSQQPFTVPGSGTLIPTSPHPWSSTTTNIKKDPDSQAEIEQLQEDLEQLSKMLQQALEEIEQLKNRAEEDQEKNRDDYPLFDLTEQQSEPENKHGTYLAHGHCTNCQQEVILRIYLGNKMPDQDTGVTCPRCLVDNAIVGRKFIGVEQVKEKETNQHIKDNMLYGD